MSTSRSLAFYGKLPCAGDFIGRNLEYSTRLCVDKWLAEGFEAFQKANAFWLDRYLTAPVWCFVLPANIWADAPVVGAIMPSVDKVGRYFPFVSFFECTQSESLLNCCGQAIKIAMLMPELLAIEISIDDVLGHLDTPTEEAIHISSKVLDSEAIALSLTSDISYWWRPDERDTSFSCGFADSAHIFSQLFSCEVAVD